MAKYTANPITVDAFQINYVSELMANGKRQIKLDDDSIYVVDRDKMSRMDPDVGDYLVRTPDGYEYLNPKAVFESKYTKQEPKP